MSDELGICCNCVANRATGFLFIPRRGPTPGKGWGCVVCDLPSDGAVAVICDVCAKGLIEREAWPRYVCTGYAKDPERTPFFDLSPEKFDHDPAKHADPDEADVSYDGGES